ncbi:MAG TPA: SDR family oxidoreductase [Terriglobales bacterium]|nr:SDR family oxidoreductase [Terriglobales bacterium]
MALYLITGIAGFIGSSLAHALLDRGERVRGIDNLSTGNAANVADIGSRIEFIEADLNHPAAVAQACRDVDYVLHQAAIPSVPRSVKDPMESNRANIDATVSLLVAARDARVKRVVYASSSSLYGDTPTLPKHEGMLPAPISPYAVAKLAGEYYMASFYRVYGMETVALRYFNVFGPRQDPTSQYSGVMAKFISSMLRGEQPTIYGDGEQSRDFTFVENVVDANLRACIASPQQVAGRAFNAATGRRVTINEMYGELQKLTGYSGPAEYGPERVGDIKHSHADISRIQAAIGYKPVVTFQEGLRRTVEWYRTQAVAAAR